MLKKKRCEKKYGDKKMLYEGRMTLDRVMELKVRNEETLKE